MRTGHVSAPMRAPMRAFIRVGAFSTALLFVAAVASACTSEDGLGAVRGELFIPNCWQGSYDLVPTFFAASSFRRSLALRVQRGSDFQTYADAAQILIDNIDAVRGGGTAAPAPAAYGEQLELSLPAGVSPPGVPLALNEKPSNVHFTLILQQSCRTQNIALYAISRVALNSDGTCGEGQGANDACTADLSEGRSRIIFRSLSNGDPTESNAAQRLNDGEFTAYLGDPRNRCADGRVKCLGKLQGNFNFYFQRSKPAQPFP
jgi:hypothetical protein